MKLRSLLALVSTLVLASGCTSETGASPGADGDVARTSSAYSTSATYSWIQPVGGWGGTPSWIGCAPGDLVTGIYGRAGAYIDQIGLFCAHVNADGTMGSSYMTNSWGGSGGSWFSRV